MTTILKNRLITTDQTVGLRPLKPSTIGSARRGAEADRAANAGSSRRAGPGSTSGGERFMGKALKSAFGDWLRSFIAVGDSIGSAANCLKIAEDIGDDSSAALYEQMGQVMMQRLFELAQIGLEFLEQFAAEKQATPQAEASTDDTEPPETGTGEIPHSGAVAGALDASSVRDEGRTVVLDHLAAVSIENVATVDAATRMQASAAEWKKGAIKLALDNGDELEAHLIRYGLDRPTDYDPVGTMVRKYGSAE